MKISVLIPCYNEEKIIENTYNKVKNVLKARACLTQGVKAFEDGCFYDVPVDRNNTIEAELEHFVDCVQNNDDARNDYLNQNSGLLGAKVVRLLELARKSVEEERTESVDL